MNGYIADLTAAANAEHVNNHASAPSDLDAIQEIQEHFEWLNTNLEEEDPDVVKLENVAHLLAATQRYAMRLYERMSVTEREALHAAMLDDSPLTQQAFVIFKDGADRSLTMSIEFEPAANNGPTTSPAIQAALEVMGIFTDRHRDEVKRTQPGEGW